MWEYDSWQTSKPYKKRRESTKAPMLSTRNTSYYKDVFIHAEESRSVERQGEGFVDQLAPLVRKPGPTSSVSI